MRVSIWSISIRRLTRTLIIKILTGRVYRLDKLINPNPNRPNLTFEFLGITKVWRWTKDRMRAAYDAGLVIQTRPGAVPQLKRYLDEQRGIPLGDVWTDIPAINSQAKEQLGCPTQKPAALIERILGLSSKPGDVGPEATLVPFAGCPVKARAGGSGHESSDVMKADDVAPDLPPTRRGVSAD
jgi:DNA methylase